MRLVVPVLVLAGCSDLPDEIRLTGTVFDGPEAEVPLPGASVAVLDEGGTRHGRTTAGDGGDFEVLAPTGDVVFLDVEADGYVTTSHTGVAGVQEVQMVEEGTVYGYPASELSDWEALFAGCPGLDAAGGAVFGEVRLFDIVESDTGEHPTVGTAVVEVDSADGTIWEACYLDDAGTVYDPDAEWTGSSGRFAIFGIPEGQYRVTVSYEITEGAWGMQEYPVRVPPGGVAPRFPLWAEFGL